MLASLLQSMLPPGFDLEKTISQVTDAIKTTVATVQRIESKIDALAAAHAEQAANVPPLLIQGKPNDDRQQHAPASNPHAATGTADASAGNNGSGNAADA